MAETVSDGNAYTRAANTNRPEVSANYKCALINHSLHLTSDFSVSYDHTTLSNLHKIKPRY